MSDLVVKDQYLICQHTDQIPDQFLMPIRNFLPVNILITMGIFYLFRLYHSLWAFAGENEMQTAIREIKEETNIDVSIDDPSFRQVVVFNPRRDITKEVVYFLARAVTFECERQEEEIADVRWVEIGQAGAVLNYDNDRLLVNRAKAFLAKTKI